MATKRSYAADKDCIVGLTQDMLDSMRGSYNGCAAPNAPAVVVETEGWTKYSWIIRGSESSSYDINVSVPDNWDDGLNCSGDLDIECSCPDAERQAQFNRANPKRIECPEYCKHVYKCLSGLVETEEPETKRKSGGGKSFDERLNDYNTEVGAMIMFETRAKSARGGPCKVCGGGFFPGDEVYVNEGPCSRTKMCKSCVQNRFDKPDPEDNVQDLIRELYGEGGVC